MQSEDITACHLLESRLFLVSTTEDCDSARQETPKTSPDLLDGLSKLLHCNTFLNRSGRRCFAEKSFRPGWRDRR